MIDLAPGHKQGLAVENPVLLGAGSVGLGDAVHPELELEALGAVVVGPLTWQSRAGAPLPRLAPLPAGALVESGAQNRGIAATLRHAEALWARRLPPVVVQVAEWGGELERLVQRLSRTPGVAGLELLLPPACTPGEARRLLERATLAGELPVWAKLPLRPARELLDLAAACVKGGAAALVVAQPPRSRAEVDGVTLEGASFGPATSYAVLDALEALAVAAQGVPLIAAGGFFTEAQLRAALEAGAAAVQLDAVAWLEPTLPGAFARALGGGSRI